MVKQYFGKALGPKAFSKFVLSPTDKHSWLYLNFTNFCFRNGFGNGFGNDTNNGFGAGFGNAFGNAFGAGFGNEFLTVLG